MKKSKPLTSHTLLPDPPLSSLMAMEGIKGFLILALGLIKYVISEINLLNSY